MTVKSTQDRGNRSSGMTKEKNDSYSSDGWTDLTRIPQHAVPHHRKWGGGGGAPFTLDSTKHAECTDLTIQTPTQASTSRDAVAGKESCEICRHPTILESSTGKRDQAAWRPSLLATWGPAWWGRWQMRCAEQQMPTWSAHLRSMVSQLPWRLSGPAEWSELGNFNSRIWWAERYKSGNKIHKHFFFLIRMCHILTNRRHRQGFEALLWVWVCQKLINISLVIRQNDF